MLILRGEEKYPAPSALVLGGFDGLHRGHRALLNAARATGLPVGMTTLVNGKGPSLFRPAEREFLFLEAGVSFVFEWTFTKAFREISAEDFLCELFSRAAPKRIFCGEDFRFGKGALGGSELLKKLAPCPVEALPPVLEEGTKKKISTSACKEYLRRGELEKLNACLGEKGYFIGGEVEHGRGVGRRYGFPTVNLGAVQNKILPPDGVYAGRTATAAGTYPCILNIGARPTFDVEEKKVEAYLSGFSGDLYGQTVRIYPTSFLRPIQTFPSAEALREQLMKDKEKIQR